ncbi:inverse autotransporter beta domain-containing protein [Litorivicinus sp.]|nr:inverse autotransporter beta domain-containing protein [Litorivicinus sp.]
MSWRSITAVAILIWFGTQSAAATKLSERINQTVRLGESFGVWIDADVALNQEPTLNYTMFSQTFKTFSDLNPANLEQYAYLFPEEFWALNQYLMQLYTDGYISAASLTEFRQSTADGLARFLDQPLIVDGKPSNRKIVSTQSPELDYFLELVRQSTTGKEPEKIIRIDMEKSIDEAMEQKTASLLKSWFPNSRLRSSFFSGDKPQFDATFISPLIDNTYSNLFAQTGFSRNKDGYKVSQGLGFRILDPQRDKVLGANMFVDHQPAKQHTRGSIGVELLSNSAKIFANRYIPLSDYKNVSDRVSHRPADGWDASLHVALPYLSNLYLTYALEAWNFGAAEKSKIRSTGLKGEILPNLSFEVARRHASGTTKDQTVAKLTYNSISDGHDGSTPFNYSESHEIFDTYRYHFVERDQSMPMATSCSSVSFGSVSFETDTLGATSFNGWTVLNQRIILGTTSIAGALTPTDSTYPTGSPGDAEAATFTSMTSTVVADASEGSQAARLLSTGVQSSSFAVVRGPAIYTNLAAALGPLDTVSFDWKAENGADSFDVFGYFINETTGNIYTVLNETGTTSTWQTVTFAIPEEGAYRFVFVSGSYDETGGQALGASLYLDNIAVYADLSACEALQNQ